MVFSRAALLLCVAVGAAVGRRVLFFGSDPDIQTPVLFFDNKDLDGGSKNFPVVIPPEGGCAPCENLNFFRTNSWESYVAGNGTSIQLFDGHGCDGKTSGKIAPWGTIRGTLADSVDSFILCYEPLLLLGEPGRPYPTNIDD